MNSLKKLGVILLNGLLFLPVVSCRKEMARTNPGPETVNNQNRIKAESFAYPVGPGETVTEAKDRKDDWYNAQDFTVNNHLGEDWNKNSGGNTDCGEPVFAAADGLITYASDAGKGWGNVIIIEHTMPDGQKFQTLYGHLEKILTKEGEVKKRQQIGTVGNAGGTYLCHLHFELRDENCPMWNKTGPGYSSENSGWLDPSDFIDQHPAR
ncbi:MAG: M23 family metallopeptidase [Pyrinomonadaceae bacterium]